MPDVGERPVLPGWSTVRSSSAALRTPSTVALLTPRTGLVLLPRQDLLDRLSTTWFRVVALVAGPGYGKSTVLRQWAERLAGLAAWHICVDEDNDPAHLLSALGEAAGLGSGIVTVASLVAAARSSPPRVFVLDDLQKVTQAGGLNVLTDVIDRLPDGWRVAFASRNRPRLPIARLRAAGDLLELDEEQLSMRVDEQTQVLESLGVRLSAEASDALHDRTEGWPAGVALAAMATLEGGEAAASTFSGDDRFVREYLRAEVMSGLGPRETSLLIRCAILDELSGPMCDAVLRVRSSGATLDHLATDRVIRPVGRDGDRYECHPLLHDLLRAELHRKEPMLVPVLHQRAAGWLADNGMPERAIEHAHRGGDVAGLARMVLECAQTTWASGRIDTVHRWMSWLEEANDFPAFPAVAAHAALIFALVGEPARADRWSAMASEAAGDGTLSDGSTVAATLAYLRAIEARQGAEQMRLDARQAWDGMSAASPFRVTMLHTQGLAALLAGELDSADDLFVEALEAGEAAGIDPLVAMVLCERATVAVERGEWRSAVPAVRRAAEIVADGGYGSYWTSALVHAWSARTAVHQGRRTEAARHARNALDLRPLLTHALPVVSTQALLTTAQASLALGDLQSASATVQQATEIMRRRPGLGNLPERVEAIGMLVHEASSEGRVDKLTPAEVRLMPYLATQLTFPMIGERLGITGNTVKTQAISSYRKLGVSSRMEAVALWERLDGA